MKRQERIDRIELMRTYIRIVEAGSLSAAAGQMDTTQATVSRRLQSLEGLLGVKLILRTTHAMKLTDDGERCYRHARQVVDAWLALEDDLRIADDRPVGVLRVRAPHAFGQQQLLAPLVAFLQRHPQLSVEWMLNDNTVDFLSDNIDCAIRVGAEVDPATVSVLLAEVPRCVVASPELLAKYPPLTSLEALSGLPWISINTFYQHEVRLRHQASGQIVSTAITPCLSTDSLYVARNTALAGLGVAMVSSWTVVEDIAAGRLIELFPQWRPASLPVHLVYPWARYYPTRLRKFLDLMREIMPDLAGMQRPQAHKNRPKAGFLLSTLTRRAVGESVQRWLYGSRYDHRRRLYLQRRTAGAPSAVTRCFRDIVRSWRTGHWRGGMAMTRHYDRLAHRGSALTGSAGAASVTGACSTVSATGAIVSTGAATTGVVSTASGSTTTGSGSSVTGAIA